ncbi:UDP-N-acetylglucosamine 1-carboxyvinyltransferase [Paenibacillaceae bacterium]|nr:UDP-N-acetylglucosamine 1-carboxyvinyltransferase [Paenibacillaceae bacterium]
MSISMSRVLDRTIAVTGGRKIGGEVRLSGAKNAALPMIAAACLGEEPTTLLDVPTGLRDVQILIKVLKEAGASIQTDGNRVSCSRGTFPGNGSVAEVAGEIRYSLLLLGLTAAMGGEVALPVPGGCKIGDRKYDLHLMGLGKLGAVVTEEETVIRLKSQGLRGESIELSLPTTSGTENLMIAAAMAQGETMILNANTRPEIMELGKLLNLMGADITCSNRIVRIRGKQRIRGGVQYSVMPGWDEAVTYIAAAAATGGELCIPNFNLDFIQEDAKLLREIGVELFEWGNALYVQGKRGKKPFNLFTAPYPGINSDMQPIFAVLALVAPGQSSITDQRFADRFKYIEELKKFGSTIHTFGNTAIIDGGTPLRGANVKATDLRGGAACVLAGLLAEGETVVGNISQIERGYEDIAGKLAALGAAIELKVGEAQ